MIAKAVLISCLATTAAAACPVNADLSQGIQLTQGDGTVEVFRDRGNNIVEVTGTYPDDFVSRTLLGKGIYVLELIDLVDGKLDPDTRMTFGFPMNAADFPTAQAGGSWTVKTVGRDIDGTFPETLDMRWGDASQVTYGDCTYDMIPGTLTYQGEDYGHIEVIHYLPALGIGVLHSYQDDEMGTPDVFPVTAISTVEK